MPKNEVDEFLGSLSNNTEQDPFAQSTEDPFGSETVEVKKEEEATTEEKLPFHKDPKVQRYIQREIEKATKNVQPVAPVVTKADDEDPADDVLTRIIGNDTNEKVSAIKDFKKVLASVKEEAKLEAKRELEAVREAERQEELNAQRQLNEAFESIEENYNVDLSSNNAQAKKTRNEFIEFVQKVAPKDENGDIKDYPDFNATFELFTEMKKSSNVSNSRAKELSTRSMARSTDTSAIPQNTDKSWRGVEKWLSGLTK